MDVAVRDILVAAVVTSHPPTTEDNYKTAFATNRNGDIEIYAMDLDGSNLRNLTNNSVPDFEQEINTDGGDIVLSLDRAASRTCDTWIPTARTSTS